MKTSPELELDLREAIRTIPDYPSPGIMFRDITTLLGNARAFRRAVDELVQPWAGFKIDKVAGIEARGFILGGAVAHQISSGFVPIRKKGKLPYKRVSIGYSLEYGIDEMEMHVDAVTAGERVILVDDSIATGGSATAAVNCFANWVRTCWPHVSSSIFPISVARKSCAASTCRSARLFRSPATDARSNKLRDCGARPAGNWSVMRST